MVETKTLVLLLAGLTSLVLLIIANVYGSEILVDNTKKRMIIVTSVVMDCYKNDTGCEVKAVETNKTDIGNLSKPLSYNKDFFKL